ncbi:MAG: hypothetical protein L0I80_07615 [Brevibacterium sp.]|uniref:hypothetical protein n=1 Tax=Brevibacterium sp. TaxID=1701 RepID=UPI002649DB60|nr:hypothetical protein [Brevibacterium sp.]MDN5808247.1 hypothetical protein [Brevibacterium sp.]MDN5876408.1 hypothetical protein [Brevibacterium sp.]MDN5910593.1 hypothetical protein [Brevibacterium sp.]MDN6123723.1 hypothetical protein [Brevibacterium sp.]MDN6134160.1 hypothetical protein [Brevibacterium sp.]
MWTRDDDSTSTSGTTASSAQNCSISAVEGRPRLPAVLSFFRPMSRSMTAAVTSHWRVWPAASATPQPSSAHQVGTAGQNGTGTGSAMTTFR